MPAAARATSSKWRHDPAPVRLVVVRRDATARPRRRPRSTRSVRWTAWRVSLEPAPATIAPSPPSSPTSSATRSICSSSVSVAASPVVPATTRPSEPLREQVAAERHGRLLVDRAVGAERRDHGGQQAFVGAHGRILAGEGASASARERVPARELRRLGAGAIAVLGGRRAGHGGSAPWGPCRAWPARRDRAWDADSGRGAARRASVGGTPGGGVRRHRGRLDRPAVLVVLDGRAARLLLAALARC